MSGTGSGRSGRATAVLGAAAVYFLVVFACGFVLGVVRTVWLVPRVGVRTAELVEMPIMLVVIYVAARGIARWFSLAARPPAVRLAVGVTALLLLLAAELGLVLRLRGLSPAEYLQTRDPVSGAVYALSLLLFAVMPVLVARRTRS